MSYKKVKCVNFLNQAINHRIQFYTIFTTATTTTTTSTTAKFPPSIPGSSPYYPPPRSVYSPMLQTMTTISTSSLPPRQFPSYIGTHLPILPRHLPSASARLVQSVLLTPRSLQNPQEISQMLDATRLRDLVCPGYDIKPLQKNSRMGIQRNNIQCRSELVWREMHDVLFGLR